MNREILGDWVVSGSKANCFADDISQLSVQAR